MRGTGAYHKLDQPFQVTEAIIDDGKSVSLDWQERNCKGYLRVTKSDGGLYRGTWGYAGYPGEDPAGEVYMAIFYAPEGAAVLFGRLWEAKHPEGEFAIHVIPNR